MIQMTLVKSDMKLKIKQHEYGYAVINYDDFVRYGVINLPLKYWKNLENIIKELKQVYNTNNVVVVK